MQFLSEKFIFNGITSDDMSVELITFDDDIVKDFGNIYKQDLSSEGNLNNMPFYSETFSELEDTILNVMLTDIETGMPKKWTTLDIQMVSSWLKTKAFKPFISEDDKGLVYYFKCVNINKHLANDFTGYLECTFKMFGNYAYKLFETTSIINGNGVINIVNTSSLDDNYKPIIKVTNLGGKDTINNITLGEKSLLISGLDTDETITIDNKMCTVLDDSNSNRISNVNRKWISLVPGDNELNISGNCKIEIFAEFPVIA